MEEKVISRAVEKTVKKISEIFPVIMITGPRQVGKTTLLKLGEETGKMNYVSLDSLKDRILAQDDPEMFLSMYETPLIIDEFQYAPDLLSYIKINVDKKRIENLKENKNTPTGIYYLTGSQVFHTMEDVSESLAGRVGIIDLYGLSTRELNGLDQGIFIPDIEILKNKEKCKRYTVNQLYERILMGSYPEIYRLGGKGVEEFYETYIRTYIERDIRELINVKDENKFIKFVMNIAARTGQELNITDVANSLEITNNTADNWLSILKNTGLIFLLQPYSNNNVNRIIKKPKVYFMDTGLVTYLTGYTNATILEKSAYSGPIFETYVITEIIKSFSNNGIDAKKHLYYYRDSNGKEIDLLINYNNKIYPIEIKKSMNPKSSATKNFNVVEKFGIDIGNGGVICLTNELFPIDKSNYLIPIELI